MENRQLEQEDDVDLKKYIDVLVKRRKFIFSIFLISVFVTAVINFLMPRIYEVSMIIEPPVMATNTGIRSLDTVENIQAKINAGVYSERIVKDLMTNNLYKGENIGFKIFQPKYTSLIRISLEEQENKTGLGMIVLNKLLEELRSDYTDTIEDKKDEIDRQTALINSQISTKENEIELREEQLVIQSDREAKLLEDMQMIKTNSDKLLDPKDLSQARKAKDDISSLIYSTTISQNINYSIELQDELTNLRIEKENTKAEAKNLSNDINDLKNEIEKENFLKKGIHNVKVIQEPQVSIDSVKPNKEQNILLSALISMVVAVLLVFFMEFGQKSNTKRTGENH